MLLSASFTCLDACCCHGLRLPKKLFTYLLTYQFWLLHLVLNYKSRKLWTIGLRKTFFTLEQHTEHRLVY